MNYFDKYVSNYDMKDPDINYKYYHSYRVMEMIELLANRLKLSPKDIHIAKVIGILHDIGRFEQDKLYNNFYDGKMDHGDYGVKVLKETMMLDETNIDQKDYEIVYKAIKNHNKYAIEEGLTEREKFFSRLIRDADKLDILYALGQEKFIPTLYQDNNHISLGVKTDFFNNKCVEIKKVENKNDSLVTTFSYAYDINFKESYKIIYNEKYYDKIYQRIIKKEMFTSYIEHLNKYIEERID